MTRKFGLLSLLAVALVLPPLSAFSAPPQVKTPDPVIYLADNLDEKGSLGWCIDTVGRGFNDKLHAHSCKPQGGDVQFTYDAGTQQLKSATYAGKCATYSDPQNKKVPFGLLDCVADRVDQRFSFSAQASTFHPADKKDLCVAVGAASRSAGPFMSRDLIVMPCASADPKVITWVVRP